MKQHLLVLLIALGALSAQAQEGARQAPLNPEFKTYQQQQKKGISAGEAYRGYVPHPYQVHFENFTGPPRKKALQELPEKYDLREQGYVSGVRNQGNFGTCWAFSAIGAVESRWMMLEGIAQDLSEKNMATCNGYMNGINQGGNMYMASAYLTRLDGPLPEQADPYYELTDTSRCRDKGSPEAYVPEVRFLPDNREEVKRHIMNYGAVATSMHVGENQSDYYNPSDYTWYYNGDKPSDHGVLIVGWDDNKVVTGGPEVPETKGAWIIKNSWGPNSHDNGYFYLAYKDTRVLNSSSAYPHKWETTEIDSLHHYDKLGMISSFGNQSEVMYGLTRFDLQEGEVVEKIGTHINTYDSQVDIILYDEFDQQAGKPLNPVDSLKGQQVLYPGYHTFDLATDEASGDLYVEIRYQTPGYGYPLPVETAVTGYADPRIEPSGVNWYSGNGKQWNPMGSDIDNRKYDLCIRAYTRKTQPVAAFETNGTHFCLQDSVEFTSTSTGGISSYQWSFGSDAEPAQASGEGPHKVQYASGGTKTIQLKVEGPAGRDSIIKQDYVAIAEDLHIFFSDSSKASSLGDTITLRVNGRAQNYEWSGQGLVSSSGPLARVSAEGDQAVRTTIRVTGTTGSCADSDSIALYFEPGPSNDDVCDAMELSAGTTEGLTNKHATVQPNEPMPDTTDPNACTAPMSWCAEGGLQHSVWFSFSVPKEGQLSVVTQGMDTQIAIYEAAQCSDILEDGKHTLLAANDDYFGSDQNFAAAIMDLEGLNTDQTYWLQLDGSAGGATGTFSIRLDGTALGVDEPSLNHPSVEVFPNPSRGHFTVKMPDLIKGPLLMEILSPAGQKLWSKQLKTSPSTNQYPINLSEQQPGLYLLKITGQSRQITQKILIR